MLLSAAHVHASAFDLLHTRPLSMCSVATACDVVSALQKLGAAVTVRYGRDISVARRWRKRIFFWWIAARHAGLCRGWFDFVASEPVRKLVALNGGLPLKPFTPYLCRGLDVARRMRVIQDSLRFITERWDVMQVFMCSNRSPIAKFALDAETTVTLCMELNYQKEGEVSLLLCLADGTPAAVAAFALERKPDGSHRMRIARVQGTQDAEVQRRLEKLMHGLRPKSLMIFACQEVAHALGVQDVFGVSNELQVYRQKVLVAVPGLHALSFDYDALWAESGGVREAGGWFVLPARLVRRQPAEMKPNKRSMYKKRYAMMDDIVRQIHIALKSPAAD